MSAPRISFQNSSFAAALLSQQNQPVKLEPMARTIADMEGYKRIQLQLLFSIMEEEISTVMAETKEFKRQGFIKSAEKRDGLVTLKTTITLPEAEEKQNTTLKFKADTLLKVQINDTVMLGYIQQPYNGNIKQPLFISVDPKTINPKIKNTSFSFTPLKINTTVWRSMYSMLNGLPAVMPFMNVLLGQETDEIMEALRDDTPISTDLPFELDPEQKVVIKTFRAMLSHPDPKLMFVQGPPGTGKTTVIIEAIRQALDYLKHTPDGKVIVSAVTKNGIENVAEGYKHFFPNENFVYIVAESSRNEVPKALHENTVNKEVANLKSEIENIQKAIADYKALPEEQKTKEKDSLLGQIRPLIISENADIKKQAGALFANVKDGRLKAAEDNIQKLLKIAESIELFRSRQNELITHPGGKLYFISSNKLAITKLIAGPHVFILDEASQANEMITAGISEFTKSLMVGDPLQLRSSLPHEAKVKFHSSLMHRSYALKRPFITLNVNYRAQYPALIAFIKEKIYPKLELAAKNTPAFSLIPPFIALDAPASTAKGNDIKEGTSYWNPEEIKLVIMRVHSLLDAGAKINDDEIMVICPYRLQREKLAAELEKEFKQKVKVLSVDSAQGHQANHIIFSAVRSNAKDEIGFLVEDERLNVAISRAKISCTLVGDMHFLLNLNYGEEKKHLITELCDDLLQKDCILTSDMLAKKLKRPCDAEIVAIDEEMMNLRKGWSLINEENHLSYLNKLITLQQADLIDNNVAALQQLFISYYYKITDFEALISYIKSIPDYQKNQKLMSILAEACIRSGSMNHMKQGLDILNELANSSMAYFKRAVQAKIELGLFDQALEGIEQGIRKAAERERSDLVYDINHLKALCFYKMHNYTQAINLLISLITPECHQQFFFYNNILLLIDCYLNTNNTEEAERILNEYLPAEGRWVQHFARYKKKILFATQGIIPSSSVSDNDSLDVYMTAVNLITCNQQKTAIPILKGLLTKKPPVFSGLKQKILEKLISCYLDLKLKEEATIFYQTYLPKLLSNQEIGNNIILETTFAKYLLLLGQTSKAMEYCEKFCEVYAKNVMVCYKLIISIQEAFDDKGLNYFTGFHQASKSAVIYASPLTLAEVASEKNLTASALACQEQNPDRSIKNKLRSWKQSISSKDYTTASELVDSIMLNTRDSIYLKARLLSYNKKTLAEARSICIEKRNKFPELNIILASIYLRQAQPQYALDALFIAIEKEVYGQEAAKNYIYYLVDYINFLEDKHSAAILKILDFYLTDVKLQHAGMLLLLTLKKASDAKACFEILKNKVQLNQAELNEFKTLFARFADPQPSIPPPANPNTMFSQSKPKVNEIKFVIKNPKLAELVGNLSALAISKGKVFHCTGGYLYKQVAIELTPRDFDIQTTLTVDELKPLLQDLNAYVPKPEKAPLAAVNFVDCRLDHGVYGVEGLQITCFKDQLPDKHGTHEFDRMHLAADEKGELTTIPGTEAEIERCIKVLLGEIPDSTEDKEAYEADPMRILAAVFRPVSVKFTDNNNTYLTTAIAQLVSNPAKLRYPWPMRMRNKVIEKLSSTDFEYNLKCLIRYNIVGIFWSHIVNKLKNKNFERFLLHRIKRIHDNRPFDIGKQIECLFASLNTLDNDEAALAEFNSSMITDDEGITDPTLMSAYPHLLSEDFIRFKQNASAATPLPSVVAAPAATAPEVKQGAPIKNQVFKYKNMYAFKEMFDVDDKLKKSLGLMKPELSTADEARILAFLAKILDHLRPGNSFIIGKKDESNDKENLGNLFIAFYAVFEIIVKKFVNSDLATSFDALVLELFRILGKKKSFILIHDQVIVANFTEYLSKKHFSKLIDINSDLHIGYFDLLKNIPFVSLYNAAQKLYVYLTKNNNILIDSYKMITQKICNVLRYSCGQIETSIYATISSKRDIQEKTNKLCGLLRASVENKTKTDASQAQASTQSATPAPIARSSESKQESKATGLTFTYHSRETFKARFDVDNNVQLQTSLKLNNSTLSKIDLEGIFNFFEHILGHLKSGTEVNIGNQDHSRDSGTLGTLIAAFYSVINITISKHEKSYDLESYGKLIQLIKAMFVLLGNKQAYFELKSEIIMPKLLGFLFDADSELINLKSEFSQCCFKVLGCIEYVDLPPVILTFYSLICRQDKLKDSDFNEIVNKLHGIVQKTYDFTIKICRPSENDIEVMLQVRNRLINETPCREIPDADHNSSSYESNRPALC